MHAANTSLANLSHTGFAYPEYVFGQGGGFVEPLMTSTGATQQSQYQWSELSETIITEAQLQQSITQGKLSTLGTPEMQPFNEQLTQVKQSMGLNILELAAILQVSRPTIYGWIESKEIKIHKKNQERLNSLYEIGKTWEGKHLGRLGSYLHKPLGAANISLFALLKSGRLNLDKIHHYLDNIAQLIVTKRQADEAHENLLRKHGFEPMSKKEMADRLNDIDSLD